MTFSALERDKQIESLQSQVFDLLIIGGGITGAGIALDASLRGLKIALIEKEDFAAGTSSRSTKLIHGGLRYLKQFEISIVRETGHERAILYRNAPHIVFPEKMLLPIIEGGSLGKYSTSFGLYVYDHLAGVKKSERRHMLNKADTLKQEPLLREDILLGSGLYMEYRSDDARLVIEVLKTAHEHGALSINYVKAEQLLYENGQVIGASVEDVRTNQKFLIKAKKVVSAAGPWVDELRKADNSLKDKRLHLTKGVHIVVPKERVPLREAVYFDVPKDGRMVFAIPRQNIVYIGTTDTNYQGDINQIYAEKEDVDYILAAANYIFPSINLSIEDVQSSWAGVRPLIHEDGKSPEELSRKDEIFISESGLITIAGGKLTGYRKMAERTVDVAMKQLEKEYQIPFVKSSTESVTLAGGHLPGEHTISDYKGRLERTYIDYNPKDLDILAERYGSNTGEILERSKNYPFHEHALLKAEVDYSIEHEMCQNISDFIIRRTGRLYFERPTIEEIYPIVQEHIVEKLQTPEAIADIELQTFEQAYQAVIGFKSIEA